MSPLSHGELRQMEEAARNAAKEPDPIELEISNLEQQINDGIEGLIMKAVSNVKVKVNKPELIRALELDKELREGKLVEVVRCKDCKYRRPFYRDKGICDLWATDGIDVFDDGFCNYGERRDPNDKA